MEQTEEKIEKAKKYNAKLFPIYKMFSWDLLFYYAINFLFLTQVKGFSASNILLMDACYTIFKFIFQIPSVNISETFGKRKSILLGNVFVAISIFIIIISQKIWHVLVSYFFMSFGFILKDMCDSLFLRDCITTKEHPGTVFTNLDGKGSALWYFFEAITSISCGFLFVYNNYLPLCLCLITTIISCIFAFNFKSYETISKFDNFNKNGSLKTYLSDIKIAFRNLLKSNRLKALFLFSGLFTSLFAIRSTIASSLFTEIGVKEEYFGIIFAFLSIFSALASKFQNFFHKRFKNKLLTYFSMTFSFSLVGIGLFSLFCRNYIITIICVLLCYSLQYAIKGAYLTIKKRYLNSFSSSTMGTKIYSLNTLIENLFSVVMCVIASILLNFTTTAYTAMAIRMYICSNFYICLGLYER